MGRETTDVYPSKHSKEGKARTKPERKQWLPLDHDIMGLFLSQLLIISTLRKFL